MTSENRLLHVERPRIVQRRMRYPLKTRREQIPHRAGNLINCGDRALMEAPRSRHFVSDTCVVQNSGGQRILRVRVEIAAKQNHEVEIET